MPHQPENNIPSTHERTAILIGSQGLNHLHGMHVLVAGLGGVGGQVAEALGRAGIGHMTLLDHDTVAPSNINRQVIALHSTVGQPKTQLMSARLRDINPDIQITEIGTFLRPEDSETLLGQAEFDYVIDCIDSIACKAALVASAQRLGLPVVSSMGAGGRMDPTRIHIASLNQTHTCALAREMRKSLKALDANLNYPVVFSDEPPVVKGLAHQPVADPAGRPRSVNGTISYMPALFGLTLAGHVIQNLLKSAPQKSSGTKPEKSVL